jgi:nitrite reductase/ring-hydroxylating ferredoxin subunit
MAWELGLSLSDLKQKSRETKTINGVKVLFIWNHEEVHAVQAQCPHLNMPLIKGCIENDDTLVCPFHKSAFNLKTGAVKCWSPWPKLVGPLLGKLSKEKKLPIYPTRIDGDQIFVDVSSAS